MKVRVPAAAPPVRAKVKHIQSFTLTKATRRGASGTCASAHRGVDCRRSNSFHLKGLGRVSATGCVRAGRLDAEGRAACRAPAAQLCERRLGQLQQNVTGKHACEKKETGEEEEEEDEEEKEEEVRRTRAAVDEESTALDGCGYIGVCFQHCRAK